MSINFQVSKNSYDQNDQRRNQPTTPGNFNQTASGGIRQSIVGFFTGKTAAPSLNRTIEIKERDLNDNDNSQIEDSMLDQSKDLSENGSVIHKDKSKTLVQQDQRKKKMWAQRVSKIVTEPAPVLQQQTQSNDQGAQPKKKVRARARIKSKNNSILDDSVDQFLKDEQMVHQSLGTGESNQSVDFQLNGLQSIQEEQKEIEDDPFANNKARRSNTVIENKSSKGQSNVIKIYNDTSGKVSESHTISKENSIIIVNNINVTNTNVNNNIINKNEIVQHMDSQRRRITILKNKEPNSRNQNNNQFKTQGADQFREIDLISQDDIVSHQQTPTNKDRNRVRFNSKVDETIITNNEYELEFDDPDQSLISRDNQEHGGQSSDKKDRKNKRVKVNVNKRMSIRRPPPQLEQNSIESLDKSNPALILEAQRIQQQQVQGRQDESIVLQDTTSLSKPSSTVPTPKNDPKKDEVFDIMKDIEENIRKQKEEELKQKLEEEQKRMKLEYEEQHKKEQEERQKREEEERLKRQEEEKLRKEQEEQSRKELEDKIRKELEEKLRKEQEERLKLEQIEKERIENERKQLEEIEKQKKEAEELRLKQEQDKKRIEQERIQKELEEKKKKLFEERERLEQEKLRREREQQAKKEEQERLFREQLEKEDQEKKQKMDQDQKKLQEEREQLNAFLRMAEEKKIEEENRKKQMEQNRFVKMLTNKNNIRFEDSSDDDESMISDIQPRSPKNNISKSDISVDQVQQLFEQAKKIDSQKVKDNRYTFGQNVQVSDSFIFSPSNEDGDIQNILEDSFFKDPTKRHIETSPMKQIQHFQQLQKHSETRNVQFSPSGTPSFTKNNQSLSLSSSHQDSKRMDIPEIKILGGPKPPSPTFTKQFRDSPLKIIDQSPDNFSPSIFNPSQMKSSIESGTMSLKSSPNQKRMMEQFNASRDDLKGTSMILIDTDQRSNLQSGRMNYLQDEAPGTERANRKSSRNQFAVSNNKAQSNIYESKPSRSPIRKPREYTTQVKLDDENEEEEVKQDKKYQGHLFETNKQKIGPYPGKKLESQISTIPGSELSKTVQKNGKQIPSKSPLRTMKKMVQTEQSKSQVFVNLNDDNKDSSLSRMNSSPNQQFKIKNDFFTTLNILKSESTNELVKTESTSNLQKKPIIQNKEKKIVKVILDDDETVEDQESSTVKTFAQLLKTPSDSICDSFHDDPKIPPPKLKKAQPTGKSASNLHKGQQEPKFVKRNLFESQINLKDMGDGELSPINPRKSYLLDKNKSKLKQPTKITETDPQLYIDKIKLENHQESIPLKKPQQSTIQKSQKATRPQGIRDQHKQNTKLW